MEIFERIKELRKDHLHLSQAEFGQRLGISRGSVANIELNLLKRPEQKEPIIKLICREFNVSEHWLRTGEGEPFIPEDMLYFTKIGKLAKENHPIKRILLEVIDTLSDDQCDELYKKFKEYEAEFLKKEKE